MNDTEIKVKHLEMVQGVINRMASNSFYMKGWAIILITGFYAFIFSSKNPIPWFVFLIPLLPCFCFWFLDAYYLRLEKLFRKLHNWIADCINGVRTDYKAFDMNFSRFKNDVPSTVCLMIWNQSVTLFHVPIIVVVILFLVLKINHLI